ncbi:DUF3578 domain-containing protein [Oceanobacillus sp. FSL K6-2867]|uniref:MrcB family domain-containing protein n=1 Tax=Oceanobacillus sp. FSL K6-2867 TaxID=2954748 RepID=UPI0030DAD11D
MLEGALLDFLKNQIKAIPSGPTSLIRNEESVGFYVQTNVSREKGGAKEASQLIKYDSVLREISKLLDRKIVHKDEIDDKEKASYILSILTNLPFATGSTEHGQASVQIIKYKTDQLPEMNLSGTMQFLDEIIAGTYHPKKISTTIQEEGMRRTKLRARQGLRLLGFLDDQFEKKDSLINEYQATNNKTDFLKQRVLTSPYLSMIYSLLKGLNTYSKNEKINVLKSLGMKIVQNSRGDNLMLESVADYRTRNILTWLKGVKLVDEELNPSMTEEIRPLLQQVMNEYLMAKREPIAGHMMGSLVRNSLVSAFGRLNFIPNDRYEIKGSVGQGNWAAVPWLAIMNKDITTSTQRGYYIVYLFSEDMERLYLTLAQGVTESSRDEMAMINEEIRSNLKIDPDISTDTEIELGSSTLAKKYELSAAAYILYEKELPSEETLQHDLERMINHYEQYIAFNQGKIELTEEEETNKSLSLKDTVDHVYRYIKGKGFYFEKTEIINLILSLKTKPFVILSGISGTGKTKIVQWLAEAIGATEDNNQFTLIPVRPDWNDGSDLLGYTDIKGDFKEGPLTKVVIRALRNPTKPYIVLLDEMNLARVEYYFSDILSVMESRAWKNGDITTSNLLTEEAAGLNLQLPSNVYIVGTVNMDETTHPFSKKVLDRANTIEFNRVQLGHLDFLYEEVQEKDPVKLNQEVLEANYLHLKDVFAEYPDLVRSVTEELVNINEVLQLIHGQVGYRVRDEICMYLTYNQQEALMDFNQAFDHCLLQKILPRIAGSDSRVSEVLNSLIEICAFEIPEDADSTVDLTYAKYPSSTEKLLEMRRRLVDGFTSFWIS